ncbi:type VI secretion system protein TssA [Rhizobium oryziradicis]|uniref:type VI secretion system protein TssA n=1 Tax=Rhizobium oryziradicis TaxID=1867956 RepID=UPI00094F51AD|nr:type VI secretion system protein TssA [Rhizobium oryziradicis]
MEENAPCGCNIRTNIEVREIYYKIKDARNQARAEERSVTPGEVFKVSSDWNLVSNLGLRIISSISKDIEVLAWLAEAHLRLKGFAGLSEIYDATAALLDTYWDDIHSIDENDVEEKLAPLAGLNGFGTEGTLIQPLRLVSLIPGEKFGALSLWDYQLGQRSDEAGRREAIYNAATEAGVAAMSAHLAEVNACIRSFAALSEALTARCGQLAPPSSNIRNVLQEIAAAVRSLGGRDLGDDGSAEAPAAQAGVVEAAIAVPVAETARVVTPEGIASRDEAFELLMNVARYFRRTEPHSPISLAIETLVRRGRMDFSELLAELLPELQTRNAVLTAAGIKPTKENGN